MEPIAGTGSREPPRGSPSPARSGKNLFAIELRLSKAGELLRHTAQYGKWTELCQKDDGLAAQTADMIVKRHELLETAKKGKPVDRQIFDSLTEKIEANGIFLFKSHEVLKQIPDLEEAGPKKALPGVQALPPALPRILPQKDAPEQPGPGLSQADLLILNVQFKNYILNNGLVGYGDPKKLYLPLGEIARTLDFNIQADAGKGMAQGWIISEERDFHLDLSGMEVRIEGKTLEIPPESTGVADNEIYVKADLLSKWFPVDFSFDFSSQSVQIHPREKLPFQARMEREKNRRNPGSPGINQAVYPRLYSEYEIWSPPTVDIGLTGSFTDGSQTDDGFGSGFYLLSKGDFAKMTSEIYLSGNDEDGLDNARLTLKKEDPDANLLGPLKATSLSAGDIRSTEFPILGGGETERGFRITNEEVIRSRQFDTTHFEGSLPPGWDVEVYRNNMLMDTLRVGADGRYTFNEIPIYYGKNDFTLKFYGPQGQERVETKRIDVGRELLKTGKSEYDLSLSQKDEVLYDPEKTYHTRDEETPKLNVRYQYGLNSRMSLGGGVSSQNVLEERHNYINLGIKGTLEGIYLSGDYLHDTRGGDGLEILAQTGLDKVDLNLKQQFFNDFLDDNGSGISDPLISRTEISASSRIEGDKRIPDIPVTFTYKDTRRENSHYTEIGSRAAANIKNLNLNNYLRWTDRNTASEDSSDLNGSLQAIAQKGKFRVRGNLDYEIHPDIKVNSAEISNLLYIDPGLNSELSIKKDMEEDVVEGALKMNWNNGKYILSPQVSYDSDHEFKAMLTFSASLGMQPKSKRIHLSSTPMADKGAASVRVYDDKNYNGVFDKGDEPIEGATVKAVQSNKEARTDEEGVALLTLLEKNRPSDIVLDKDSLEDPFWEPLTPGRSIVPRPGHVQQMEIPVAMTGEIDGMVFMETLDGREKPLSNVPVQLVDSNGKPVQEVRSEHDGFYYFSKVFPGEYRVRIDPENTILTGSRYRDVEVFIDREGTIASGRDILLEKEPAALAGNKEGTVPKKMTKAILPQAKTPGKEKSPTRVSEILSSGTEPLAEKIDQPLGLPRYGLHLTSYRTAEKAAAGIKYLTDKYKGILDQSDFSVKKVHVSDEKGIWYRVIAGSFGSRKIAEKLGKKIKLLSPYCKIVQLKAKDDTNTISGVHLTSFRTRNKALLSIQELKDQYPALLGNARFSINSVDLGPEKGKWKRVVAGRFTDPSQAQSLARKIKMKLPYCKAMEIEKDNEYGIHMASYRTLDKASRGLQELQGQFPSLIRDEDFSIRRVDLGAEKGIWYRIFAGRFKDKASALSLKTSLNGRQQYANIIHLTEK